MHALLSVSDKTGITEFAKGLQDLGYGLLSTGGTLKLLLESGIDAKDVSDFTGSPEMFEGRVKTLHPMIHGGILYCRDKEGHCAQAEEFGIEAIDLVCVNLYPFRATIHRTNDFDEIIENIDIGGPTMVRSAAKNFKSVTIVTDVADYGRVLESIKHDNNTEEFRRNLMIKAYEHTASYDALISNYMNNRFNDGFGAKRFIFGEKVFDTRYGENPHQCGAVYQFQKNYILETFHTLKGEASFNNMTDLCGAVRLAASFGNEPAVSIIKHANPCGFAMKENLLESYKAALRCDPLSAYGGVVAINGTLDKKLAEEINNTYIEVLIAATVLPEALEVFESKKRIKIFEQKTEYLVLANDQFDFRHIEGGFVFQNADKVDEEEVRHAKCMGENTASAAQLKDLEIAYKVAALTKSNCVAYVKDSALVAIGMGMTSRVDASRSALRKAEEQDIDVTGAALASEAFFPFRDSIDAAAEAGVGAVIQPGGSMRDKEVVLAANEHQIPIYFTGIRHFLH